MNKSDWLKPTTIIAMLCLITGLCGAWYAVQTHCADTRIHKSTEDLRNTFVDWELYKRDREEIIGSLQRIERSIEKTGNE